MALKKYAVQPNIHQSTAGAAAEIDTYVVTARSSLEQLAAEGIFGSFALTYDAAVPGVDVPFMWQFGTLMDDTPQAGLARRRARVALNAGMAGDEIDISISIRAEPPTEEPLFMNNASRVMLEVANPSRTHKKLLSIVNSSWWDNKGYDPKFMPAITYSGTTCQLLSEIQRHMLEWNIDQGVTWSLWTEAEVLGFLNERLARFIRMTSVIEADYAITATSGSAEYNLPQNLINLTCIEWENLAGEITTLVPVEQFTMDNGDPGWQTTPGTPVAFISELSEELTVTLCPTPDADGTIHVEYVPQHTTVTSMCIPIEVPGMFIPYIKYGVMADMLSKQGEANDPQRASYCEGRFSEGIELAGLLMGWKK